MENLNKVEYFDLFDYISKIKLNSQTLEHMEETSASFDEYMRHIKRYDYNAVQHMWLIETANELANSMKLEHHYIPPQEFLKKNLEFDTLKISHERIHNIHNFVLPEEEDTFEYRLQPARVSYLDKNDGTEHIYWRAAEPEDIKPFMDTFLTVYDSADLASISSNPFLKSALIKLLFIRIHPYGDGNGRTSRVLYNMKFTELINRIYGTNLKLCPLNISANILINQITYVNILDSIYFDMDHDNNLYINKWFDFILNMADEQLYYLSTKQEDLEKTYELYKNDEVEFDRILNRILNDIKDLDSSQDVHQLSKKKIRELI